MYLEIAYGSYVLKELPLKDIGDAKNLQAVLEGLFHEFDEEYDLSDDYGNDEDGIGCWVTDLEITAIYI